MIPLQGLQEDRVKSSVFPLSNNMHDQQYFNFSGKRQPQAWTGFACKNLASRPIATLKLIWRSRKLHFDPCPNK